MDWRTLPSLGSLRTFTAVAETKSLSAAGRELNVTHAAVSQQVKGLEQFLGLKLMVREGRGIALTPEGRQLYQGLSEGFATILETVGELLREDLSRPLNITTTPSFAISWLMPRISDFRHKHPDIELMINPTADVVELRPGGVDLAVRFGKGDWPGLEAEIFIPTNFAIVGADCLIKDKKIEQPEDILQFPWLQEYGTNELTVWLESQGVVPKGKLNITHLPGYMVLEGLRRGDGISATAKTFIEAEVKAGSLKILFEEGVYPGTGYHLVTRPGVKRPPLKAFLGWLRAKRAEQEKD